MTIAPTSRRIRAALALATGAAAAAAGLLAGGGGAGATGPVAQPPQTCFFRGDDGPITNTIHVVVEPLVEPFSDTVHGISCDLAEYLGL